MTYAATPQQRDQIIDDARRLLDWLEAHPDLPINPPGIEVSVSIDEDSDEADQAMLRKIAASIGANITNVRGNAVTDEDAHRYVKHQVGTATYEAVAITQAAMDAHITRNAAAVAS